MSWEKHVLSQGHFAVVPRLSLGHLSKDLGRQFDRTRQEAARDRRR